MALTGPAGSSRRGRAQARPGPGAAGIGTFGNDPTHHSIHKTKRNPLSLNAAWPRGANVFAAGRHHYWPGGWSQLDALAGTATYAGAAAGLYSERAAGARDGGFRREVCPPVGPHRQLPRRLRRPARRLDGEARQRQRRPDRGRLQRRRLRGQRQCRRRRRRARLERRMGRPVLPPLGRRSADGASHRGGRGVPGASRHAGDGGVGRCRLRRRDRRLRGREAVAAPRMPAPLSGRGATMTGTCAERRLAPALRRDPAGTAPGRSPNLQGAAP